MTALDLSPSTAEVTLPRIPVVFCVALAMVAVISLPNLADPMIRHDDYPALLGNADAFWSKTLNEGRWVNYLWHLRGIITPSWLNFAAYQICWAIFATACALTATGHNKPTIIAALMAALILVAPTAGLISFWFNPLLPGLAFVALYAAIACRGSSATARWLLPDFTVLTFMSYTTYPLLLLAVGLVRTAPRSVPGLLGVLIRSWTRRVHL